LAVLVSRYDITIFQYLMMDNSFVIPPKYPEEHSLDVFQVLQMEKALRVPLAINIVI